MPDEEAIPLATCMHNRALHTHRIVQSAREIQASSLKVRPGLSNSF